MSVYAPAAVLNFVRQALPDESWPGPVESLSGGALNQVCRVRGAERSVIFKHAPPHVASQPELPLDDSRLRFEAAALRLFQEDPDLGPLTATIRPPELLHQDESLNFILLEDLNDGPSLAETLPAGDRAVTAGIALGRFIAKLHLITADRPDLAERFDNRPIQQTRLELQYASAARYAEAAGATPEDVKRIDTHASGLGERLLRPGRCLIMGDLWPPSILPRGDGFRLIDWEFAHYGQPLQDCAHLAAHCRMHVLTASSPSQIKAWLRFREAFAHACPGGTDDPESRTEWNLHFAAEILMRTAGPFRSSGPFAEFDDNDPRLTHARDAAIALLARPDIPEAV